jgi:hypothetical protein
VMLQVPLGWKELYVLNVRTMVLTVNKERVLRSSVLSTVSIRSIAACTCPHHLHFLVPNIPSLSWGSVKSSSSRLSRMVIVCLSSIMCISLRQVACPQAIKKRIALPFHYTISLLFLL